MTTTYLDTEHLLRIADRMGVGAVRDIGLLDLDGFRLTAPDIDAAYDLVIAAAAGEWEVAEVSERPAAWATLST